MVRFSYTSKAIPATLFLISSVIALSNVFESLHQVPRGWTRIASASPEETVRLRVSLKQQNLDQFYDSLMQVSTPGHPQYGKHYEGHELRSLLKPTDEATATAISWLQDNNVTTIRDDGDYLFFRTTVATANKLLDTDFHWYENTDGDYLLRTTRYSVPDAVAMHINFVQPTTRFGTTRPLASHVNVVDEGTLSEGTSKWISTTEDIKLDAASATSTVNASCDNFITPQCLFQLYNINLKGSSAGNNSVGYASFVGQNARFSDMATFSKVYAPFTASRNVSCEHPIF